MRNDQGLACATVIANKSDARIFRRCKQLSIPVFIASIPVPPKLTGEELELQRLHDKLWVLNAKAYARDLIEKAMARSEEST
jgi:hypothetical protein